ncbi:hypothetical protein AYI70_g2725 [Smittium culicis]|uniref:Uncharacterized protein n=1 Tax=Smittium culicis TaxID=133412 RepID=A0A1R1Y782_9FUNG|nr:hypothetical protein AYI70_g2725 [Smittium culicis]
MTDPRRDTILSMLAIRRLTIQISLTLSRANTLNPFTGVQKNPTATEWVKEMEEMGHAPLKSLEILNEGVIL